MTANRLAAWATVGLAGVLACGSSKTSTGSGAQTGGNPPLGDDSGTPGSDAASGTGTGSNTSPDGFAYPTPAGGYGKAPRSGNTPGAVIQNFKFLGYPKGDRSQGDQLVALANFYDPCVKHYKLIHLSVAAVWCTPCNQETDEIVAAKAMFDAQGVVMIQALDDGPTLGVGATQADLDGWMTGHRVNFTEVLDPGLNNLHGFFDAAAVPWNADIDPRTMEILDATTGLSSDGIVAEVAPALQAIQAPPGYPIAVSCN